MNLAGQVALVTGGAVGIGEAVVRALAAAGAEVIVNYHRSEHAARELARRSEHDTLPLRLIKADVSKPDEVKRMVLEAHQVRGRIDILVNNAGVVRDGLILSMTDDAWEDVQRTNLSSVFYSIREVGKLMMRQRSGRIVNISSHSGRRGGKGQANYAASKAALNALTRVAAIELAPKGITVNAIAPGMITTRMSERVRQLAGQTILSSIPVGRYGEPQDVAGAVLFLAQPAASYVTGQVIDVNGGLGL